MSIPKRTETIKRHIKKYEKYLQSEKRSNFLRGITISGNSLKLKLSVREVIPWLKS